MYFRDITRLETMLCYHMVKGDASKHAGLPSQKHICPGKN